MTRDQREFRPGQFAVDNMEIGPANSAGENSDQYLTVTGIGPRQIDFAERFARGLQYNCLHISLEFLAE